MSGRTPSPRAADGTVVRDALPVADPSRTARSIADRAAQVRYRRAISLLVMTLFVPGSAQVAAGNARVGRWAIRVWVALWASLLVVVAVSVASPHNAIQIFTDPDYLLVLMTVLVLMGLAWAALFIDAWRIGRPMELMRPHRLNTAVVNIAMAFTVVSVLFYGAHMVSAQRGMIMAMFGGDSVAGTANGRYNVLLIGGDSGTDRWGLRTDSMTIASIDARTGQTVLIGLPRNMMNFKFPEGSRMAKAWPNGYDCSSCELNSLATYASDHRGLFAGVEQPGVEATIEGVEGITKLKISYWAMINMPAFSDLVNAVGGVKINIRQPIAIGRTGDIKGWIQPGYRVLKGDDLLWYTRSRATSDDYSRMARQKCVMNAMLQQVSPAQVIENFPKIASASAALLQTSIPSSEIDHFATLAMKAKGQKIATVSLVPPLINTSHPDETKIQNAINAALHPDSVAPAQRAPSAPKAYGGVTEGSYGSLRAGYTANHTTDLGASC
jgi:polyisoprenyl-teichoic acid--peptidoglycan teichoic acid transferase